MHLNHYCVFWRRENTQTGQVLFCHTPEERMLTFSQAAATSALTINSDFCLPLPKVKTLCLICGDVGVDNACVVPILWKNHTLCAVHPMNSTVADLT